jgi:nucleotide-binding universal stress UspA family protein
VQVIPVSAIIGTVGRCYDFTRTFLPRHSTDEQRWAGLRHFVEENSLDALPPIEVYQVGSAYFVQDGHHRVSIARQLGVEFMSAYVTEVATRVALTPETNPDDLIRQSEYVAFLGYTHLDRLRPQSDFSVSVPGQYAKLEDHIEVHRYFIEVAENREISFEDAVCRWHDEAYAPIIEAIREQGILRDFPERTATDFYLWIAEQRLTLQHELGWSIPAEAATASLAARFVTRSRPLLDRASRAMLKVIIPAAFKTGPAAGQWRKTKVMARYSERLFGDVLVPISDAPPAWAVLDQALLVARQESSQVHGLHIVATEAERTDAAHQNLRDEFERRCAEAQVTGSFNVEMGPLAAKVGTLSELTDLVVIGIGPQPRTVSAEVQTWMRHCTRPVLAVPDRTVPFQRALLAYDGSVKAKEALFVAAYLAEMWKTALVVMTVQERGRINRKALTYAEKYLQMHEIDAEFVFAQGVVAGNLLKAIEVYRCDTLLMGSYCSPAAVEAFLGGTVDRVLRATTIPVLVCR